MKMRQASICLAAATAGLTFHANPAIAAGPRFSPPGVYGRIDVARYTNVQVVTSIPLKAAASKPKAPAVDDKAKPVYLWVPAGHRSDWATYCARYSACGFPVLFVDSEWYYHEGPGKGSREEHDHKH